MLQRARSYSNHTHSLQAVFHLTFIDVCLERFRILLIGHAVYTLTWEVNAEHNVASSRPHCLSVLPVFYCEDDRFSTAVDAEFRIDVFEIGAYCQGAYR